MIFPIRHRFSGKVLHSVDVGDRHMPVAAPDLRGMNFMNANLCGAELCFANLENAIFLGADLREADLRNANLRNADMRYCDFTGADLRESNLENAEVYPSQVCKTSFWGARITPGSDVAELCRLSIVEARRHLDGFNGTPSRFHGIQVLAGAARENDE